MAEGIVYLDVDDEITSAASRIRSSAGTKIALVVPYGSRIATSRINFRLLSREALVSNRRLSVIAGDAASRALAASAGPPVFSRVTEYEAAVAAVALAVVAVGAAAYLPLPSATIAITPRHETIGPIPLTISADPTATSVDPQNSVIPALHIQIPVEASQTFTTTGKHVEQAAATGSVTFTNYDTGGSNSVPAGSVVSTQSGIRFKTLATVNLPPADFFPVFVPSRRSVAISAVAQGPGGNVAANTIRVVPQGENPELL